MDDGKGGTGRQLVDPSAPQSGPAQTFVEFFKTAFLQSRLSRDRYATVMHLAIFWGMLILFLGTALATIDQDFTNLPFDFQILQGHVYRLFELALDTFGVVLIVGMALAAYRRYVTRPERLAARQANVSTWDTFPFLACLALIAVTGFLAEGLRIAEGFRIDDRLASTVPGNGRAEIRNALRENFHLIGQQRREQELDRITAEARVFPAAAWAPVGYALAIPLSRLSEGSIQLLHQGVWWAHALVAFGFMIAIPFTKAFHLFSSPLNLLFRDFQAPRRETAGGGRVWRSHGQGLYLAPVDSVRRLHLVRPMPGGVSGVHERVPDLAPRRRTASGSGTAAHAVLWRERPQPAR